MYSASHIIIEKSPVDTTRLACSHSHNTFVCEVKVSAVCPIITKIVTPDPENLESQVSRHTSGIPCSSEKQQLERHGVPQNYAKTAEVL